MVSHGPPPGRALDGVVVVDLTQAIAGPYATRVLAELGARVIKVEGPRGDLVRTVQWTTPNESSPMFAHGSAGKESVCIDLSMGEGHTILAKLFDVADVIVENFRPGTLQRLGFPPLKLVGLERRPIVCSISGFGQEGPHASWSGADPVGQALSGMTYMTGDADGPPYFAANGIADTATAMWAATAILAALYERRSTGAGRWIDVSMSDVMISMDCVNVPLAARDPDRVAQTRMGRHHPAVCPFGVFDAADGHIVIEALGEGATSTWGGLCRTIDRTELIDDPRSRTQDARLDNRDFVNDVVQQWAAPLARWDAVHRLQRERVIAAPVLSPAEAVTSDHARARDLAPNEGAGDHAGVSLPLVASGMVARPTPPPQLGEHNRLVARDVLSITDDELEQLHARGVLLQRSEWP